MLNVPARNLPDKIVSGLRSHTQDSKLDKHHESHLNLQPLSKRRDPTNRSEVWCGCELTHKFNAPIFDPSSWGGGVLDWKLKRRIQNTGTVFRAEESTLYACREALTMILLLEAISGLLSAAGCVQVLRVEGSFNISRQPVFTLNLCTPKV